MLAEKAAWIAGSVSACAMITEGILKIYANFLAELEQLLTIEGMLDPSIMARFTEAAPGMVSEIIQFFAQ